MFAGGLDFSLPVRKYFYDPLGSGKAFVDCVVSLTGFALVGGPARQDAPKVGLQLLYPKTVHAFLCSCLESGYPGALQSLAQTNHAIKRMGFQLCQKYLMSAGCGELRCACRL